jgi:hypothetical protein
MFRGLDGKIYEQIRQGTRPAPLESQGEIGIGRGEGFHVESEGDDHRAVVRSISPDGSLFEIELQ